MERRDLASLSSNYLEALGGDRKGQHSIRINRKWRICFEWPKSADGPENVEIVDYH
jgi:proteic killer suppression protein